MPFAIEIASFGNATAPVSCGAVMGCPATGRRAPALRRRCSVRGGRSRLCAEHQAVCGAHSRPSPRRLPPRRPCPFGAPLRARRRCAAPLACCLRFARCAAAPPCRGAAPPVAPAAAPPAPRRGCRPLRRSGSPGSSSRAAPCGSGCAALRLRPSPSLRGAVAVGGVAALPLAAGRCGALLGSRGAGGGACRRSAVRCAAPLRAAAPPLPSLLPPRRRGAAAPRPVWRSAPGRFGVWLVRAAARVSRVLRHPLTPASRRQLRRAAVRRGWPTRTSATA